MRSLKEAEMSKYIKILGIAIFFILALFSSGFAEEESFTITTYYPSPYGSYNELSTTSNTYLATGGSGKVIVGTRTTPNPDYKLDVAGTANVEKLCIKGKCISDWSELEGGGTQPTPPKVVHNFDCVGKCGKLVSSLCHEMGYEGVSGVHPDNWSDISMFCTPKGTEQCCKSPTCKSVIWADTTYFQCWK